MDMEKSIKSLFDRPISERHSMFIDIPRLARRTVVWANNALPKSAEELVAAYQQSEEQVNSILEENGRKTLTSSTTLSEYEDINDKHLDVDYKPPLAPLPPIEEDNTVINNKDTRKKFRLSVYLNTDENIEHVSLTESSGVSSISDEKEDNDEDYCNNTISLIDDVFSSIKIQDIPLSPESFEITSDIIRTTTNNNNNSTTTAPATNNNNNNNSTTTTPATTTTTAATTTTTTTSNTKIIISDEADNNNKEGEADNRVIANMCRVINCVATALESPAQISKINEHLAKALMSNMDSTSYTSWLYDTLHDVVGINSDTVKVLKFVQQNFVFLGCADVYKLANGPLRDVPGHEGWRIIISITPLLVQITHIKRGRSLVNVPENESFWVEWQQTVVLDRAVTEVTASWLKITDLWMHSDMPYKKKQALRTAFGAGNLRLL